MSLWLSSYPGGSPGLVPGERLGLEERLRGGEELQPAERLVNTLHLAEGRPLGGEGDGPENRSSLLVNSHSHLLPYYMIPKEGVQLSAYRD